MYSLVVVRWVIDELGDVKRYPAKVVRQIVLKIFELSYNPRPQDVKRIGGDYRVDSGEYRIYYAIDDQEHTVTVLLVGKRGDDEIYRKLKRKFG